jgi:hypothetical protein
MRTGFEKWMTNEKKYETSTARNYSTAINRISKHYSSETGRSIDIYKIKDISLLKEICKEYNSGRFKDFGDAGHGSNSAAISAYIRYFEKTKGGNSGFHEETNFSISNGKIAVKKSSTGKIVISINFLLEEEKK